MNTAHNHSMGATISTNEPSRTLSTKSGGMQLFALSATPPGTPGLDVSGWQILSASDWNTIAANGAKFAYVKATESTDYKSSQFGAQYQDSYNVGLIRGAYHFATPNTSSGAAQANFFVDNGGGWTNDGRTLPPLLDIEYNPYGDTCYGMSAGAMVSWIADFSNTVLGRTGRLPAIYSTTDWWTRCTGNSSQFSANPLFIARYPNDISSGAGTLPAGWSSYTFWQYASSGVFPGDQDVFNGSVAQLQAFAYDPASAPGAVAIDVAYAASGGAAGPLGAATTGYNSIAAHGGGLVRGYANGAIAWSASTGAHIIAGEFRNYLNGHGGIAGDLGWPNTDANAFAANGGGAVQGFQGGAVLSSGNGTYLLTGRLRSAYNATGSIIGPVGWPTSEQSCASNGTCSQEFQAATIAADSSGSFALSVPGISAAYSSTGGITGVLGKPVSGVNALTANGGGFVQAFQYGAIAWSPTHGAHPISGAIRDGFNATGGIAGYLGWPSGDVSCDSQRNCSQTFVGGIAYSAADGSFASIKAQIVALYNSLGGATGKLGKSIGSSVWIPDHGGGFVQAFTNGAITFTDASGAVLLQGEVRTVFGSVGGISGPFGWPTGQPSSIKASTGSGSVLGFQNGAIASSASGTFPVSGPIRDEYGAVGGITGPFGWPTSPPSENSGGLVQAFQNGAISWSSATGAHSLSGVFRAAYASVGGIGGRIGWPTSDQIQSSIAGGGTIQSFQSGAITLQGGKPAAAVLMDGPVRDYFNASGGLAGPLGWPTSSLACASSTECSQSFTGGTVFWSASRGTRVETAP
jgi:uncharacterized protein with LGFP repeats